MTLVVAEYVSLPILYGVPTASTLIWPCSSPEYLGPSTSIVKVLPPEEVHFTLKVPFLPDITSMVAFTDETVSLKFVLGLTKIDLATYYLLG